MDGLTLRHVYDARPDRIAVAAHAWLALAADLDDAAGELIRGSRPLEDVWPTGGEAHQRMRALRSRASNAYQPCKRIGDALREHADTVRTLQRLLRDITAEAARQGYTVDIGSGTVSGADAHRSEGYARELRDVLRQAADLDRRTSTALDLDRTGLGAGSVPPADPRPWQGRPPAEVNAWWRSLTPDQQERLLADHPVLAGSLDGIPAADRDIANRIVLDRDIAALTDRRQATGDRIRQLLDLADQGRLADAYPHSGNPHRSALSELERLRAEQAAIDGKLSGAGTIRERLSADPPAYLLGYSSEADGRAIVAIGDPDRSDHVVTYVPGTTAALPLVGIDLDRAGIMARDATLLAADGSTTSSIMWLGYDAPDHFTDAASTSYAAAAATELRHFQSGLRATHEGEPSHNTVIGHSYGSTAVGFAARTHLAANDLIFVGSPGVGVHSAADLHFDSTPHRGDGGSVWSTTARNDVIHLTGIPGFSDHKAHGTDPSAPAFGAHQITSAPGRSGYPGALDTHIAYWNADNPARSSIAAVIAGRPDLAG